METRIEHAPAHTIAGATARAALVALAVLALLVLPSAPPTAAGEHGLVFDATTTYTLDVGARVVRVEVDAHLTNTLPAVRRGNVIETPYFYRVAVPVVGPVDALTASGPGGGLATSVEPGEAGTDLITVDLSPTLVHGSPQDVTIRYELTAQPPRSEAITRVNDAYAAWFVAAAGDPQHAEVRILVPRDFELGIAATPTDLKTDRGSEHLVITGEGGSDPGGLYFALSVVREDAMVSEELSFDDATVTVRSWPEDRQWHDFATDLVTRGVPVLTELVGRPLQDPTIDVLETSGGSHLGFGGFYGDDGTIEVSDDMDGETLVHELAHGWVNGRLFSERWLIEGVTQELTRRATDRLEVEVEPVPELDAEAAVAVQLNEWGWPDLFDEDRPDTETWGYDASYAVANELLGGLGDEQFTAVIGAAVDGDVAYQGDPEPERVVVADDWRYVLDLVQEVGGVEQAPELYRQHVLTPSQARQLVARTDARDAYHELVARSGTWTPPFPLRHAMARWDFDEVEQLVAAADAVRAEADRLAEELAALGGTLPADVEHAYEADRELDAVEGRLTSIDGLVARLATLADDRRAVGPLGRIGLLGSDTTVHAAAVDAVSAGDLEGAAALADREAELLGGADTVGALRLAAAAGALAVCSALLVWVRRRRREPPGDEATPHEAASEEAMSPDATSEEALPRDATSEEAASEEAASET